MVRGHRTALFSMPQKQAHCAAQEKAPGLEQTEALPELSGDEVLGIKRRTVRRAEDA